MGKPQPARSIVLWMLIILLAVAWRLAASPPSSPFGASLTLAASGNSYYIATTGSDSNPGTLAQPWATLQHAAEVMQPGDTVYVRSGTYTQSVVLRRSGSVNQPLTFAAYPGETVILDGANTEYAAFQNDPNDNVSDITINGFTIRNYRGFGIVFWSINHRITLTNLTIRDNAGEGIRFSNGDGNRVQNVLLQNNEGGFDCTPILPGDGTDTGCTNLYIADTRALDNGTQGDTGTDAFAVEKGDRILVERSIARGGPGDGFDFKSNNTTLSQVVSSNTRNNFKLWGIGSTLVNALGYDATADANLVLAAGGSYTVTNVTLANMQGYAYLVTVGGDGSGPTPVKLYNTIFYNDNPAMGGTLVWFGADVQLTSDNNLYYNPYRTDAVVCADFPPYNGQCFSDTDINNGAWESHSRYADPRFVNAAAKNFRLAVDSPAIGAANQTFAPPVDLDNRARDANPDIGAYEYRERLWFLPFILQP